MERYTVFMDGKTWYHKDVNFPQFYKLSAIPMKIAMWFFMELDMLNLKYIWKGKGLRIAKSVLNKNKVFFFQISKLNIKL